MFGVCSSVIESTKCVVVALRTFLLDFEPNGCHCYYGNGEQEKECQACANVEY